MKARKNLSKIICIIILMMSLIVSLSPTTIQAAVDSNSKVESSNNAVNQIVQASAQASYERATDVSDLTSVFNKTDVSQPDKTSLLNALTSPIVIITKSDPSASGVTNGPPSSTGDVYLQANVSYLVRSFTQDTNANAATTTTITLRRTSDNGVANATINSFTIYDGADHTGPTVANIGKSKTNKWGDKVTVPNDDSRTAIVTSNIKGGSNPYASRVNGGSIALQVNFNSASGVGGATANITILAANVKANNNNSVIFNDTMIHFWIDDTLRKKLITDTIAKAQAEAGSYTPTVTVTWHVVKTDGQDDGGDDSTKSTIASTIDTTDPDQLDLNPDAFDFDYSFYRDEPGKDGTGPLYVYADISMNYMTKKSGDIFAKKPTPKVYHTFIDSNPYAAASGPSSQEDVPEVSMTNTVNNKTTPGNDSTTHETNDTVDHTMANDAILFTSNLTVKFGDYSSGAIVDGVYKTEIPKGMTISDVSIVSANNSTTTNPQPIPDDDITVEDDPSDSNKSILTAKEISLPETNNSSASQTNYTLTFHGQAPADYDNSIAFTPTFDGSGGNDHSGNSFPIDQAVGTTNFINFDKSETGELKMVPQDIDFGTINSLVGKDTLKKRVTPSSSENVLDVSDNRAVKNGQTVSISATGLVLETDGSVKFPGSLVFRDKDGNDQTVDDNGNVPINMTQDGEAVPSVRWSPNEGLLLKIQGNKVIPHGKYTTKLSWSITDSVPNI
ncbi:hypothetical protein [Companilactobacillus kimchiensis]|nr:hypothetical protein [Companilactobacillus kimchiensis]